MAQIESQKNIKSNWIPIIGCRIESSNGRITPQKCSNRDLNYNHDWDLPITGTSSTLFARWRQCAQMVGHIGANWWIRLNRPSVAAMRSYVNLDICFVECGICPMAESVMIDSVILHYACVKLPYFYFRSEIWWSERSRWSTCIIVPNFVVIGQNVAEIWQFFDFSRWRLSTILICDAHV